MSYFESNSLGSASPFAELQGNSSATCYDPKAADIFIPYPGVLIMFSLVSWIGSFLLIIGFIVFKSLRKPPGDIIFGISVAEFILNTHWIVSSIFVKSANNCTFCVGNAVFSVTAGFLEYFYNISLCVFLIQSLRNAIKPSRVFKKTFHIVSISIALLGLIFLASSGKLGKTLFGTCSIRWSSTSGAIAYFGPAIVGVYAIISGSASYHIKKRLPQCPQSKQSVSHFLSNYNNYLLCSTVLWFIFAICNIYVAVLATTITEGEAEPPYIKIISIIGNIAKLGNPLALTFIRYKDKTIKSTMRRLIFFWRKNRNSLGMSVEAKSNRSSVGIPLLEQKNSYDLEEDMPRRTSTIHEEHTAEVVTKYLRIQTAYSILSGILYTYKVVKLDNVSIKPKEVAQDPTGYLDHKECQVSKEIIQEYLPNLNFSGSETFKGQFKFHAPYLFHHLLKQDAGFIDLEQSMDFDKNVDAIRDASGADGGKSGEFFFFSSDKKIIVKTINAMEMNKLLEILPQYVDYLEDHKDSLIAKIYGVFTMIRDGIDEEEHFVVMRNVCGLPRKFVERDYDMKGSTFDREKLKGVNLVHKSELNGRGTLKDTDFFKYEHQLNIQPSLIDRFVTTMQRDANFFRDRNLIDYSLAVFIVNKKKYFEEFGELPTSAFYHELCSMENIKEEGIWYNIGIIDYLQPYNFSKMMEKNLKKIIKFNLSLDTSSQPPDVYAERFGAFARRVVGLESSS